MTNLVKKVSFKNVIGKPEMETIEVVNSEGKKEKKLVAIENPSLMRVLGRVAHHEIVTSQYGDSIKFKGHFEGHNLETGEIFQGQELFLPSVAEGFVHNAVATNPDTPIELAFDIGVKPSTTPTGYEYTVTPLMERSGVDPLAELKASLPAPKQKALPPSKKGKAE